MTAEDLQLKLRELVEQARSESGTGSRSAQRDGKASQVRDALERFRSTPVAGKFMALKRMLFKLHRSTFTQQFGIDGAVLDLIDDLHEEFAEYRKVRDRRFLDLLALLNEMVVNANENKQTIPPGVKQAIDASLGGIHAGLPGFGRVFNGVAQLRLPERVLLYSLVCGLKPRCCLEIGTSLGGSALIIGGAMDDNGFGKLICVDQSFQMSAETWSLVSHRAVLVEGRSPDVLGRAGEAAGGKIEFAFIDGDHSTEGLLRDIEAVLPILADRAYLLFHDSHHPPVEAALTTAVKVHAPRLIDCGELSTEQTIVEVAGAGAKVWGGLRLLRFDQGAR